MKSSNFAEIVQVIRAAQRILILSHVNPDPDAYGSSCALTLALCKLGKKAVCINENGALSLYHFIPGVREVLDQIPNEKFDLAIVCDCGDKKRVGDRILPQLAGLNTLVNIDHHTSNSGFGNYNLVVESASSTSELIFDLLKEMKLEISPDVANALLAGIMGDTGSFRYASTSERAFRIAADLIHYGALPEKIASGIYGNKRLASVRLQAYVLSNLELYAENRIAEALVNKELLESCQAKPEDCEHLVELIRDIEGVMIAVFIRYDQGLWKVSLRSKSQQLNVSVIAQEFGGGGHIQAAAFRWRGELQVLREKLRERLIRELANK